LLYIDIDQFGSIYENFGARASDQTLIEIARRLTALIAAPGIVARIGRDEFAIIQPNGASNPRHLAARVLETIALPLEVEGHAIALTACIGIALYPQHANEAGNLVHSAAKALRRAKREGRSRWRVFESDFGRHQDERQSLERDLAAALSDGQLTLHYQTFFDTETLQVAGCEALLRWTHPLRGRIAPSEFIPIAEANGLILPIGKWVLATACAEAARWEQPVIVAVNVSPLQFTQADLVTDIAEILATTGLAPSRLELEITETVIMADTGNALRLMNELKALGVRIAMDDFGTGHSSLGYLRKFPFDKIKIDRSFISDGDDEPEAETIVQTIIAMGRGLGLTITAEGVETPRQMAMLRSHGCTYVQGYLLARPCSAGQLRLQDSSRRWLQTATSAVLMPRMGAHGGAHGGATV
jgi:diguanylate cyclase (GGDEF)-like protein